MKKSDIPKVVTMRSFLTILFIGFGVLISMQIRSLPAKVTDPVAPYLSLKETKSELVTEQDQLKNEITSLRQQTEQIQQEKEKNVLTAVEIKTFDQKKAKAGLSRLNGSGVIIKIDDSPKSDVSEDSIVHAADLRDIINLLWSAGAEGISINGQRVVQSTAVDCIVNTVLVNNVRLTNPFQIEAIGQSDELESNLNDVIILSGIHERVSEYGLVFEVSKNSDITLPIYNGSLNVNTGGN